jgi:septum formation protein
MRLPHISNEFPLILASTSPRRVNLLSTIGIPFRSVPSSVTEDSSGASPSHTSCYLAEKKARSVFSIKEGFWVLGADTIVAVDREMLGKPRGREEAKIMLSKLQGREHLVFTGFCILNPSGNSSHKESVSTIVRFRELTEKEIEGYIDTGEPFDKAGGYAIQGIGAFMVESISGSYTNVVGLPVCALVSALEKVNAIDIFPIRSCSTHISEA